MKHILIFLILSIIHTISLRAQLPHRSETVPPDGVVTGVILDKSDKKAIEYANIVIYKLPDSTMITGAISGADGKFVIDKLPYGKYYVEAKYLGYSKTIIRSFELNKNHKVENLEVIYLEQNTHEISEVEIVAEKNYIDYKIDKKVINVSQQLTAQGGTAADVLENTPSIQIDSDGNITLRGSTNFKVLIDGRPSPYNGSDALKQIPASMIDNIEIITNPSAKYEPDGETGIVNIIMKKQKMDGYNGIINASIGTGNKYSSDFLVNYRKGKINVFAGADYSYREFLPTSDFCKNTFTDTINLLKILIDRKFVRKGYEAKLGFDYFINNYNTITISGNVGNWSFDRFFNTRYHEYTTPQTFNNYFVTNDKFYIDGDYITTNLNYTHKFDDKGHQISTNLFYNRFDMDNPSYTEDFTTGSDYNFSNLIASMQRTKNNTLRNNYQAKIDYTLPLRDKHKLESGAQFDLNTAKSDFLFENKHDNIWTTNTKFSNSMEYEHVDYAIYSTYSSEFRGIMYQIGLRGEYVNRIISQKTLNKDFVYEKISFFPTIHLTKQFIKNQQVQASYSRRINRPQDWFLNPYPDYSDKYYQSVGNPALKPEFVDSYQLNYQKQIKNSFFTTEAYYRQINNAISRAILSTQDSITLVTFANVNKSWAVGLETSIMLPISKWLKINAGTNFLQNGIEGKILDKETTTEKMYSVDFRLNATISLPFGTIIQLGGFYSTPKPIAQGTQAQMLFTNASVKHDFLKRSLTINLQIRDIFSTGVYKTDIKSNDFESTMKFVPEAPVFTISISYKINNYKQRQFNNNNQQYEGGF